MKKWFNSILKLYPAYLLTIIFFAFIGITVINKSFQTIGFSFALHLIYAQSIIPYDLIEPLNSPTWFLSTYFAILLIYWAVQKTIGINFWIVIVIAAFGFLGGAFVDDKHWFFYISPYTRCVDFLIGFQIGKLSLVRNKECHKCILLEICIILIVGFTLAVRLYTDIPECIKYSYVYLPSSLSIVYILYTIDKKPVLLSKLLQGKFIQKMGMLSMEIFIYHWVYARICFYVYKDIPTWVLFPTVLALTLLTSLFMRSFFEKPIAKYIGNKT
ncbi:acyltransferase family protein [Xylanibacter muris]|uniref:acyltransferase family protein n=1 Tax=Xylanibacter muris TaxID=2736290 RepID=UPI00350FB1EB